MLGRPDKTRGLGLLLTVEQQDLIRTGSVMLEVWSDGTYAAHNGNGKIAHGATPRLAIEALNA